MFKCTLECGLGCGRTTPHEPVRDDEYHGDQDEEDCGHSFDRHDETRDVASAELRAEIDLLRRALPPDVNHHRAKFEWMNSTASARTTATSSRGIARSTRFSSLDAARQPTDIPRKLASRTMFVIEGQEDDHAAEPANGRELQEENEKADEKEVDRGAPRAADVAGIAESHVWHAWVVAKVFPLQRRLSLRPLSCSWSGHADPPLPTLQPTLNTSRRAFKIEH